MYSNKERLVAALDAADAGYQELMSLPLETLSRPEKHELLMRLQRLGDTLKALDRRLIGRLIAESDPTQFGANSWPDVLSRRLRISRGEAERRIAEARSA